MPSPECLYAVWTLLDCEEKLAWGRSRKGAAFALGIGITPFLSILRQADHDRLPQKLYLFYSNRRPEDAPFLETLQAREK